MRVVPVAQSVEHNTFNVGVPGSSPGGITEETAISNDCRFFVSPVARTGDTPPYQGGWEGMNKESTRLRS